MKQTLKELLAQIDKLGKISDAPGELSRTYLSPAFYSGLDFVGRKMEAAGLRVSIDPAANILGEMRGYAKTRRTLILGSHLDTVHNAGRFDGALGVLIAIAAMKELKRRRVKLPYNVEIVGFSEEEGVRFGCAYIGSAAYTGQLTDQMLARTDSTGISLAEAMSVVARGDEAIPVHERVDVIGYVEVHIEQGPVLERENLAVGIVTGIAGQSRFEVTFTGSAGHAGTTPMRGRRDALAAAAEFILAVEKYGAAREAPFVATVGTATILPGAANVIPGRVTLSLDVRDVDDGTRGDAIKDLHRIAESIARRRKIELEWVKTQSNGAVHCSELLSHFLEESVRKVQGKSIQLVSGAGHDGVMVSHVAPISMLFVRCRAGLSHHPDEYASPADIEVALQVLVDFLLRLTTDAPPELSPPPGNARKSTTTR